MLLWYKMPTCILNVKKLAFCGFKKKNDGTACILEKQRIEHFLHTTDLVILVKNGVADDRKIFPGNSIKC